MNGFFYAVYDWLTEKMVDLYDWLFPPKDDKWQVILEEEDLP